MKTFAEYLNEAKGIGSFSVKKTKVISDPEEDNIIRQYDILRSGKKVGELEKDDMFAYVHGKLYGKDLPELSDYGRNKSSGPLSNLHAFLKSKTGRKWATTGVLKNKNILSEI